MKIEITRDYREDMMSIQRENMRELLKRCVEKHILKEAEAFDIWRSLNA